MHSFLLFTSFFLAPHAESKTLIEKFGPTADRIIEKANTETMAWQRLAFLGDHFPKRLSGSENLEKSIAWILQTMKQDGFDKVFPQKVMVPHWVRGKESAQILEPAQHDLVMLGLGGSVGTPENGITGEVVVFRNFDELEKAPHKAKGKIVLFNAVYQGYGKTVGYRSQGASRAAKHGAIACLIRSVGPNSLRTPHTGAMNYDPAQPKIPAAAVTLEDAELLQRMQDRGEKIVLRLNMEAKTLPDAESANVIAEIRGSEWPEQVIVFGGHIDSWDTGQGVIDDAGGCVVAWEALRLIRSLGLKPKRTLRLVLWTNEENGLKGAYAYRDAYKDELRNHVLAIELDSGIFKPKGFGFTGSKEAFEQIKRFETLFEKLGAGSIREGGGGADIGPLMKEGVPGMDLKIANENYFDFHHTPADTLDKLKPEDVSACSAALALMVYLVAQEETALPQAKTGEESSH